MKEKIAYAIGYRSQESLAREREIINSLVGPKGLEVECSSLPAMKERSELVHRALHGNLTGVVELGITYVKDFIAMNTLRPFKPAEAERIGGKKAFVEPAWEAGRNEEAVWAIPMFSDVRLVFYRRDWLERAGCDERLAFQTPENFRSTLQCLYEAGFPTPLAIPTSAPTQMTIQLLASWIWYYDQDYLDEREQRMLLDEPEVVKAAQEYFGLYKYMGLEELDNSHDRFTQRFMNGQAGVIITGAYALPQIMQIPAIKDHVGIAIPLKQAYLGGSSTAIWKQTTQEQAALALIEVLSSLDFQVLCHRLLGSLPARIEALQKMELPNESFRAIILHALETSRQLPAFSLWGVVEDRLAKIFADLWTAILTQDKPDVNQLTEQYLRQASRQLNLMLSQIER